MSNDQKILLTIYITSIVLLGIIFIINLIRWYLHKQKSKRLNTNRKRDNFMNFFSDDNTFITTHVPSVLFLLCLIGYLIYKFYNFIYNLL